MENYLVRPGRVSALAELVREWPAVVLDCETTGLNVWLGDRLLGFALANLYGSEEAYYIPVSHPDADNVSAAELKENLRPALQGKSLLGYNIKFDLHFLLGVLGDLSEAPLYDVLVLARLMSVEERPALDLQSLAGRTLCYQYRSSAAGQERQFGSGKFSVRQIGTKCCEDVLVTRRLYLHYKERMPAGLRRLYWQECKLTRCLFQMEKLGIRFDPAALELLDRQLSEVRAQLLRDIQAVAGNGFNPSSHLQLAALMERLGLRTEQYTSKGKPSWSRGALSEIAHPIAPLIEQYRAIASVQSNFVGHLKAYAARGRDVIHGTYQNWGTVTGRLSSRDPNLQAIANGWLQLGSRGDRYEPLRWDDGPDRTISLRGVLVPRDGYEFITVDWRQVEMFVAGWYLRDKQFLRLLQSDDFHAATAEWVWGDRGLRERAKWFNFGLLYGLGTGALARRLKVSKEEADRYKREYFAKVPSYSRVLQAIRKRLREEGYVENAFRRRYYQPEEAAYVAFNYLVQGSTADYVKFRISTPWEIYRAMGVRPVMTTHDDIVFEVPKGESRKCLPQLKEILEEGEPFGMRLPVKFKCSSRNLVELEEVAV